MYREKVAYLYDYLMADGQNSQRWFLKVFFLWIFSFCSSSSRIRALSMKRSTLPFHSLFRIWVFLISFCQIDFKSFSTASVRVNQIFHFFLLILLWINFSPIHIYVFLLKYTGMLTIRFNNWLKLLILFIECAILRKVILFYESFHTLMKKQSDAFYNICLQFFAYHYFYWDWLSGIRV